MKILFIASESSHFRNFHVPYINALEARGDEVHTASNGDFSQSAAHFPLNYRKRLFSFANVGVIFKLRKIMRREKYDTICTNSTLAGFTGRFALKLSGLGSARAVHICHGYLFNDDGSLRAGIYLFFEKLVRKRTDILAVMNGDDLAIAEKYSLGKSVVYINGMGLDISKFPELPDESIENTRSSLGAGENDVLFLCAAEFSRRKDQKTIIKACSLLKRSDFRVVFAGDGELLEECGNYAESLGVSDKTVFLGHCGDMNALYRACDRVISAGEYEGLPFNVMESLYCGAPAIASDVKGNRELTRELFPFGDAEALAALMESAERPTERRSALPEKYFLENCLRKNTELLYGGGSKN